MRGKKRRRIDRRRFVRREPKVRATFTATLDFNGTLSEIELSLLDISEGGVRVRLGRQLPSELFKLHLNLDDLEPGLKGNLILPCEIAWKNEGPRNTWDYGLQFVASEQTIAMLTSILLGFKILQSDD